MTRLLVVQTSPRAETSVSRRMTATFLAHWSANHPEGEVVHRDLAKTELPFVTGPWLQAYFTPPDRQSTQMKARLELSDLLVDELLAADHLVLSTPVYNYNVPASLKAWIDHIVRKGRTLGRDGSGLVMGTTATVLMASGGVYTEGTPLQDRDIATQYLKLILGVIGVTEVTFVAGGNAKAVDMGQVNMDDFVASLDEELIAAACR